MPNTPIAVKKRELTVFDFPEIDPPKFPKETKRSNVFQRNGIKRFQNVSGRLAHPMAQMRLREFIENNMGTAISGARHQLMALRRAPSTDSGLQQISKLRISELNKSQTDTNIIVKETFPPINSMGATILRRPTVLPPKPILESGDVFQWIIKGKELKPFSFQGDLRKSIDFYSSHYPLIMRKVVEISAPNSAKAGAVTEEMVRQRTRYSSLERRAMKIREKNRRMEERLKEIEDGDDSITTELRHDVFDPIFWPWNKEKYRLSDS